jgi:hypothetical protein
MPGGRSRGGDLHAKEPWPVDVKRDTCAISHDDQQAISKEDDLVDLGKLECHDLTACPDQTARGNGKLPPEARTRGLTGPQRSSIQDRLLSNGNDPFVAVHEPGKAFVGLQSRRALFPEARPGDSRGGFVLGSASNDLGGVAQCWRRAFSIIGKGFRPLGDMPICPPVLHGVDCTPCHDTSE